MATLQVSRGSSDAGGDVLDAGGITAAAVCGDGVVNGIGEACDDGNPSNTDTCPNTCQVAGGRSGGATRGASINAHGLGAALRVRRRRT